MTNQTKEIFLVMRHKKMKLKKHDKLLMKFRYREALECSLLLKNQEKVMVLMKGLVAKEKLLMCDKQKTQEFSAWDTCNSMVVTWICNSLVYS